MPATHRVTLLKQARQWKKYVIIKENSQATDDLLKYIMNTQDVVWEPIFLNLWLKDLRKC